MEERLNVPGQSYFLPPPFNQRKSVTITACTNGYIVEYTPGLSLNEAHPLGGLPLPIKAPEMKVFTTLPDLLGFVSDYFDPGKVTE